MTVWLYVDPEYVSIKANMPLPSGGGGVFRLRVLPGQNFRHYTYDQLRQMGNGRHELIFPEAAEDHPGQAPAAAPDAATPEISAGPDTTVAGR